MLLFLYIDSCYFAQMRIAAYRFATRLDKWKCIGAYVDTDNPSETAGVCVDIRLAQLKPAKTRTHACVF